MEASAEDSCDEAEDADFVAETREYLQVINAATGTAHLMHTWRVRETATLGLEEDALCVCLRNGALWPEGWYWSDAPARKYCGGCFRSPFSRREAAA